MGCAHGSAVAHAPSSTPGQAQEQIVISRANVTLLAAPLGNTNKHCKAPPVEPHASGVMSVHIKPRPATGDNVILPLQKAIRDGNVQMVLRILKATDDVEATVETQPTALYIASSYGHAAVVHALLEAGADVGGTGGSGETALHAASNYGHREVALILLAACADIDARDAQGMTALHWAARMSREDVAQMLVDLGASLAACSGHGYTPYAMAQDWGTAEVARILEVKGGRR